MMFKVNYRMAMDSLRSSRWRSFLTMLGIIIGVVAVVTVLSVGEGVKQSITAEAKSLGEDVVTVLPGQQLADEDVIGSFNPFAAIGQTLSQRDVDLLNDQLDEAEVVPFYRLPATPMVDDDTMDEALVIGVSGDVPALLNQEVRFGTWHQDDADASGRYFVVIGANVANDLFGELSPIGRSLSIDGDRYAVRGVFAEFPRSPLPFLSFDYNNAVFLDEPNIGERDNLYQILVRSDDDSPSDTASAVSQLLHEDRGGDQGVTVLTRQQLVATYGNILDVLTVAIAAIAGISLFVGGIGIMNIMFVSISERTGEIGIRKAIGATNGQIMGQFMTEAMVLSFLGGVFGVLTSLLVNYFIRLFTILEPIIIPELIIGAIVVSLAVGLVFGTAPAIRAARKDPIEALRYKI